MSQPRPYETLHSRWHRPRVSTWWWLERRSHVAFIARELSSIFVAWFVVFLLLLVAAVSRGEAAYWHFLLWAGKPGILLLNAVSLLFTVFHTVTFFNVTPQAMVVRLGGTRVPGAVIVAANYAAWVTLSALVAWLVLGG